MREFTESIVREHLAKVTAERDITVTRIDRIPDDVDRLGRPFTARQRMLQFGRHAYARRGSLLRMTELATSGVSRAYPRCALWAPTSRFIHGAPRLLRNTITLAFLLLFGLFPSNAQMIFMLQSPNQSVELTPPGARHLLR